jgi:hypothetical protein
MGLFGAFKKTIRATANTALTPFDLVSDIVTLGGLSTESGESALVRRGKRIYGDLEDALEEVGED